MALLFNSAYTKSINHLSHIAFTLPLARCSELAEKTTCKTFLKLRTLKLIDIGGSNDAEFTIRLQLFLKYLGFYSMLLVCLATSQKTFKCESFQWSLACHFSCGFRTAYIWSIGYSILTVTLIHCIILPTQSITHRHLHLCSHTATTQREAVLSLSQH